ncbi:MAG: bifunctional proline dehydrogenase/L-glutamate gamma-semialdehyde dehydrogenase PutA [Porticoccaceae bacterium]|nr:bifunctional proline dehydrogenase/L-glutamate gamma-semialdehyde dehydrogenase PutA [Porticoccaceae bacterium]
MQYKLLRKQLQKPAGQCEHQLICQLLERKSISLDRRHKILNLAKNLVVNCRNSKESSGMLDAFLLEFGLSNAEGVALMCLAEALLRVPDDLTADRLIAEKIKQGSWSDHLGKSESLFVNASTWGLMLTGQVVSLDRAITQTTENWTKRLVGRISEPFVRAAIMQAMSIMGGQYVLGRSIKEGIKRGNQQNGSSTRFSFDMLGEGARTEKDALNYFESYSAAIDEIGISSTIADASVEVKDGISVKLSALFSKYSYSHHASVMQNLLPRIKQLCLKAKRHNIGLSIDAEESYRLDLSCEIFEALARDPDLRDWQGLGFVLQAYQKRAPDTAKWLIEIARETDRRLMVRLVKGAYWDAEIKHTQELGLTNYPVFTRKANTDLCYQHCAELLFNASKEIYPQFATHNAYTATMIIELAGNKEFEFQRLHGMGHILYQEIYKQYPKLKSAVRVYAPIGHHNDLLPYLVRRLLENGANSSFVNRFLDKNTPVDVLLQDTEDMVTHSSPYQHSLIPLPGKIFEAEGEDRKNAIGVDLDSVTETQNLLSVVNDTSSDILVAHSIINGQSLGENLKNHYSPSNNKHLIGRHSCADDALIWDSLTSAYAAQADWDESGVERRAKVLENVADLFEKDCAELVSLLAREAGRTLSDGISEVREAVDFCRYYALQGRILDSQKSQQFRGKGVFLCISPWNFPLAIFVGQIAAALATGNSVIAKPAEQTPLIAYYAVSLFHRAGVPTHVLHLLLGSGSRIGNILITDPRISGIAFTGSTETAMIINRQLATRSGGPVPLVAETGGQNCMIVDSTALPEQVVDDVIASSFLSAGQRCSALRVLFLQEDIADTVLPMLRGAMHSINIGDPRYLSSDVGPVIDRTAQKDLLLHIEKMHREGSLIAKANLNDNHNDGSFVAPHAFEIESLDQLEKEIFGPILHIIRFNAENLDTVINQINATGYGLTLGIHSRIEAFAETVYRKTIVGNTYINRNMVGAVVGVNPFGGRGLSGTGPKAGGPNYLLRFCSEQHKTNTTECASSIKTTMNHYSEVSPDTASLQKQLTEASEKAMLEWQIYPIKKRISCIAPLIPYLEGLPVVSIVNQKLAGPLLLPGPTGEKNELRLVGRGPMLVAITSEDSLDLGLRQIASALLCGCSVIVATEPKHALVLRKIDKSLMSSGLPKNLLILTDLKTISSTICQPALGGLVTNTLGTNSQTIRHLLAQRKDSIIPLIEWPKNNAGYQFSWLLWFLSERTLTENIVARGGNTELFGLAEK